MLEPRSKGVKPTDNKISTGKGTLRLRSKGPATVEEEVRSLSNLTLNPASFSGDDFFFCNILL